MAEIPHVQNPVIEHGKANGWFVRRVGWLGRVGAPDTVFAKAGVTLWIEFKDAGEPPNVLQAREHKRMRRAGMLVFVIDDAEAGRRLLDAHDPDAI